jgi:GT2 family glycosyltransferase
MNNRKKFDILPANPEVFSPLVSICISNFNGENYINQCIQSVKMQKVDFEIEIILHDDLSSDNSISMVNINFPEVEIIVSHENVGFCISNNRMVEHSRGKFILLLNNDAVLRPGSLQALMDHARHHLSPCIIGLPQYSIIDKTLVDRGYYFDIFMNPIPVFFDGTVSVGAVTGACMWLPRSIWAEIGGFPSWFESVAEDIYICCVARLMGYQVVLLDTPGFDHWIGKNLGGGKIVKNKLTSSVRRRSLSERNKTFVMLITYPIPVLLVVLPIHLVFLFLEAMALLLFGMGWNVIFRIYFKLPGALFARGREALMLRVRMQRARKIKVKQYFSKFKWTPWKLVMLARFGLPKIT